jgi:hypothetical protein
MAAKKLTVLQLEAVHGDSHLAHVEFFLLAVFARLPQVVAVGQAGGAVADVAKKGAKGPFVVEAQGQNTNGAVGCLGLDGHVHGDAQCRVDGALHCVDFWVPPSVAGVEAKGVAPHGHHGLGASKAVRHVEGDVYLRSGT